MHDPIVPVAGKVPADSGVLVAQVYGHLRDEHSRAMAAKMTLTMTA
jgi:hypothetical protein